MNNKAQAGNYAIAFMLAVCLIFLSIYFAHPVNEMVTMAMNETSTIGGMNCTSTSDYFLKAGCIIADVGQFYFIAGIAALAGVIIVARVVFA